jgi:hypothetical protein
MRPILVGHAVDLATANHLPRRRPSPSRRLRWTQHGLRPSRPPGADPGRRRASRGHGGRPRRPRPSQPCGCLPHRHSPDHTPVGHSGRGNARTPDAHAGHRTPDTWTLRRPHRTPDSGRVDRHAWTLSARTGDWTPDAGRGHRQGDEGTAGIRTSWAAMLSGRALGHPTVFLWTAPAVLGNHDGSAVGHLPVRDCPSHHRQLLGRSAGEAAPRRIAVLGRFRVERRAAGSGSSVMASRSAGCWERQ